MPCVVDETVESLLTQRASLLESSLDRQLPPRARPAGRARLPQPRPAAPATPVVGALLGAAVGVSLGAGACTVTSYDADTGVVTFTATPVAAGATTLLWR